MADYTSIINALKQLALNQVGAKQAINSISPTDVSGIVTALEDALLPILNTINDFAISGGNVPPDPLIGNDLELYVQGGNSVKFWRRRNGVWVQEAEINLGINIPDGNISLQTSISGQDVFVSSGSWGIDNVIYQKALQTTLTLSAADLNFGRIDAIVANDQSEVLLVTGTASSSPTEPATPSGSVVVSYLYVPSQASENVPYIIDGNNNPPTPAQEPQIKFIQITEADVNNDGQWDASSILTGTARPINVFSSYDFGGGDTGLRNYEFTFDKGLVGGLSNAGSQNITIAYIGVPDNTPPPVNPYNLRIGGMNFGSAAAAQSYLVSKGNGGATVTAFNVNGDGTESMMVSGISGFATFTFNSSPITSIEDLTDSFTGSIGNQCFDQCASLVKVKLNAITSLGRFAFRLNSALSDFKMLGLTAIDSLAFQGATGLNNKTISFPELLTLGATVNDDFVFTGINGLNLTVPIALSTINAGNPDGDITRVLNNGGTINYV